ncbi:TIGR02270 family protein [Caballeronia glebae]|uniref:TIGR02270 family protein n=1 Tax=Caballeronia glebae TaxID=1777143 RepID=UPI0013578BD4|nr:TIGR02270 family protein [Caballeronia glebae]
MLEQHVEDAAALRRIRSRLVRAPHVRLPDLARLDERIAAHLDGVAVAGSEGVRAGIRALERTAKGELFTAAICCIEGRSIPAILRLIGLGEAVPDTRAGLHSAFGWVSASRLAGVVSTLLASDDPAARLTGLAACAQHRVDPKGRLDAALMSEDAVLRARALRCVGEIGRVDLLDACLLHLDDPDASCRFHAACSALMLGDRRAALAVVRDISLTASACGDAALALAAMGLPAEDARRWLERLAARPEGARRSIRTMGFIGDPRYVQWLIGQMGDARFARLAGESFSLITGADLGALRLECPPSAMADDDDTNDEDDDVPWPDPDKAHAWWAANKARMPGNVCHLMGAPPTRTQCIEVLRSGTQRQRSAAATRLRLAEPRSVLFNCAGPAWRQKRALQAMA